jgi:hypothetical protein
MNVILVSEISDAVNQGICNVVNGLVAAKSRGVQVFMPKEIQFSIVVATGLNGIDRVQTTSVEPSTSVAEEPQTVETTVHSGNTSTQESHEDAQSTEENSQSSTGSTEAQSQSFGRSVETTVAYQG